MSEPGIDLHEWQSQWESVAEEKEADPSSALSQFADIVERMLASRGYDVNDPVLRAGAEPELVTTYIAARETTERAELGEASRADVDAAIEDLRALFDTIAAERP